jgi:triacylglycerol lipase
MTIDAYRLGRRAALLSALASGLHPRRAGAQDAAAPVIFVHGNGDTAALWLTTLWRFEANAYPRDRMFALDLRYPQARAVDATPQPGRSSAAEVMGQLAAEVTRVRQLTGAAKVILVAQSRGGNTVRSYLKNGGGAAQTSLAILCGAVNHGVIVSDRYLVGSEFNGASAFMRDLNASPGEVVADVRFVTIRSDSQDKYAQPDGRHIGLPGIATGLSHDAPDLQGATKIVLPGVDHRETGFAPQAFAAIYREITGKLPASLDIAAQAAPVLRGKISGFEAAAPTNIGVAGAGLTIHRVAADSGLRAGPPVHAATTGADGMWGPFTADPQASYEFELSVPGAPVTHIYRSPFPRSSDVVHLRPQPFYGTDAEAAAVTYMTRPRGYFGLGRDTMLLDGAPLPGVPAGVPTVASSRLASARADMTVVGAFNGETVAARTWPARDNHVAVIEITG